MIPADIEKISDEVFMTKPAIVTFGAEHITFLKRQALATAHRRARICAHRNTQERVHEMLIAIAASSYIRPHRHPGKSESFHIVEGVVDIVIFNNVGDITNVVRLGDKSSGHAFYYRLAESRFHTLIIHTPMLIVHEVTSGPFMPEETILAPFAPAEEQTAEVTRYDAHLRTIANLFRVDHPRTQRDIG